MEAIPQSSCADPWRFKQIPNLAILVKPTYPGASCNWRGRRRFGMLLTSATRTPHAVLMGGILAGLTLPLFSLEPYGLRQRCKLPTHQRNARRRARSEPTSENLPRRGSYQGTKCISPACCGGNLMASTLNRLFLALVSPCTVFSGMTIRSPGWTSYCLSPSQNFP